MHGTKVKGSRSLGLFIDLSVFAVGLAIYVGTLAPTMLPADSGEFQIVGALWGVAHPPGYALFSVIANLFSRIPCGEIAWRLNLMGAVTGALTLAIVSRVARRVAGSPWAGIAAAGALGVSTTFWAQSTTINIRAFTVLFTALCCAALVAFLSSSPQSKQSRWALTGLAVSSGLGVAHHPSLLFFAPVFVAVVLWHDPGVMGRFREWPGYILAFALPFVANLYIVARAITGAPFGTDELVDARRVLDHLLQRGFAGDMFAYLRYDRVLLERFLVVGNILHLQFGMPLLIMSAAGYVWLVWVRPKVAVLFGGMLATMAFVVATYRAPQSVEYLMPAYAPVALCVGSAVALVPTWSGLHRALGSRAVRLLGALLVVLVLLAVVAVGWTHLPSYVQLHYDRSAREYAESVLLGAPPSAHIFANWHWYTPLLYLQLVEGARPDVEITYLYPQGAIEMPQAWAQRIAQELKDSDRPLVVTNYYHTYGALPYRFVPLGQAFRVQEGPSQDIPANLERIDIDFAEQAGGPAIRVLGYRIEHGSTIRPGDWATVELAWQPLRPLGPGYSLYVHLIGADGVPLGQRDQRLDAAHSYQPGEVLLERFAFPVFLTAAPGTYRIIAGGYSTDPDGSWQRLTAADGSDSVDLSEVSVEPSLLPAVTTRVLHRPFVDGPTLVGVDYDDSLPDRRRVYLHWLATPRPVIARLYADGLAGAEGQVLGGKEGGYVTTALDAPPGTADLHVELLDRDTHQPLSRKGVWGMVRNGPMFLPRPSRRPRYLPFGGKLALVGVETEDAWPAGEPQRVALRFLGLRPILRDYVVSVGVRGEGGAWSNSDGVPALGAIPTLKWIRGSQVADVHWLEVLAGTTGEAELTLGLYDAFTMQGLPPLDERIAELGRASVPLRSVSIQQP